MPSKPGTVSVGGPLTVITAAVDQTSACPERRPQVHVERWAFHQSVGQDVDGRCKLPIFVSGTVCAFLTTQLADAANPTCCVLSAVASHALDGPLLSLRSAHGSA